MSYDDYVCNDYDGYVMNNDEAGQNIVFESPSSVVKAIKHGGLYNVNDKYLYYYDDYIGFNDIDDATAPWNYMNL